MANLNNLKELDQVLELIHRSEKGITYAEMHDVYFSKFGIRLGDHIMKPVVDQLKSDGYITFRVVPASDDIYYSLPVAADFLVTGGYQGKASRESEFLQKDLRIKELELELEVFRLSTMLRRNLHFNGSINSVEHGRVEPEFSIQM